MIPGPSRVSHTDSACTAPSQQYLKQLCLPFKTQNPGSCSLSHCKMDIHLLHRDYHGDSVISCSVLPRSGVLLFFHISILHKTVLQLLKTLTNCCSHVIANRLYKSTNSTALLAVWQSPWSGLFVSRPNTFCLPK